MNDINVGLIKLLTYARDKMPEHYSLSHHKMGFLSTQYQLFPDTDLEDLCQVSLTAVEIISKDREIVHKNLETVGKEIGKYHCHTSLECPRGVMTKHFSAVVKHTNVGQIKFIKPNSQR